jgi:hypothetical protein
MMEENAQYEGLFDQILAENSDVEPGVMMREPALKCKGKVFAFYYADKDAMCFKLGKEYGIEGHGITDYDFLSPFKNKPPMYAWYMVGDHHKSTWEELAYVALEAMRN